MFTEQQTERYSRHILLKNFGPRGQAGAAMEFRKIKVARDPNCPVCGKDRRGRYSLPFFGGKLK
jgi:molybdopterin/thiamine biosynthesis adenylyltransferase